MGAERAGEGAEPMWQTNLKILLTVVGTLVVYTALANMIPQVESAVPEEIAIGADVTPEQLVQIGEEVYGGFGACTTCHGLGERAPNLLRVVGGACGTRKPELDCKAYLYESLTDPQAYVVEGFPPIMPDTRRTLTEQQIWALVAFLQSQGGEVTVTARDIPTAGQTGEAGEPSGADSDAAGETPGADGPGLATRSLDPRELLRAHGCVACHLLDGEGGPVGPPFAEMKGREREYLRRAILRPNADTAQGYEAFAGTMPPGFGERMTAAQLEAIIDFLRNR